VEANSIIIMATSFPGPNKVWTQPGVGDIQGTFFATFNIDVSENEGKVRLGKRLLLNTSSDDDADFAGVPVGFRVFGSGSHVYTAAGNGTSGYVFKTSVNAVDGTFSQDAVSGTPTTINSQYSDIEILNGQLFVTTKNQKVYYLDNSEATWANFDMVVSDTNKPHMMCAYGGRMYCTYAGNSIISWNNAATPSVASAGAQYTLTLQTDTSNSQITFIRPASDRIWIGTLNKQGGKGEIHEWDGSSTQVTKTYRLRAPGALACVVMNDVPYVMDSFGRLLVWNGGRFQPITSLYTGKNRYLMNAFAADNLRFIHPNGMSVINGRVSALIDGRAYDGATGSPDTFTQIQTIPSGIYEFDTFPGADYNIFQNKGLIHKHSVGLTTSGGTIKDYGQARLKAVGALAELSFAQNSTPFNGTFLCGASFSDDVSSSSGTKYGIWYDNIVDDKQKAGWFITPKIYSSGVTEKWQKIFVQMRDLLNANDKIVVKYRIQDVDSTEVVVTTTTTSAFTVSGDLRTALADGTEVEFTQGVNAGICAHVSGTPTYSAGTGLTTVTLDTTITAGTPKTSKIRYQAWTKASAALAYGGTNVNEIGIGKDTSWVQFKVWMLFTGQDELEQLLIASAPNQKVQ